MAKLASPPREPRQAEAAYIRDLTRVWCVAQAIVAEGLAPLLAVWPEPVVELDGVRFGHSPDEDDPAQARSPSCRRTQAGAPRAASGSGNRCEGPHPIDGVQVGLNSRTGRRDRNETSTAYNPLLPQPRRRPVAAMTDNELRRLWPTIEPADIRRHAPWATSRDEVLRVAFPGQGLPASNANVEAYVRQAVEASQTSPYHRPDLETFEPNPPGPGAFQLRPRAQVPVIVTAGGAVLPPPPRPMVLSREVITRQLGWLELALGETVTTGNIEAVTLANGARTDRWVTRELRRVLGIDPRLDPGTALALRQWNLLNANLIESGIRGAWDGVRLRPLLSDVAHVVEQAHMQGVRVEVLASDLVERFGVSNSRAQLIARDQVLTLNSQLNRSKQQSAGIREYRWSTSRDERVRESHQDLDGQTFSWDVGSPEGHPGEPVNCRCTAIPIIPELGDVALTETQVRERQATTRRRIVEAGV